MNREALMDWIKTVSEYEHHETWCGRYRLFSRFLRLIDHTLSRCDCGIGNLREVNPSWKDAGLPEFIDRLLKCAEHKRNCQSRGLLGRACSCGLTSLRELWGKTKMWIRP